jgi:hypothetical protein
VRGCLLRRANAGLLLARISSRVPGATAAHERAQNEVEVAAAAGRATTGLGLALRE